MAIEKIVQVKRMTDDNGDLEYWLSKPVWERLAAVEAARSDYHGEQYELKPATGPTRPKKGQAGQS